MRHHVLVWVTEHLLADATPDCTPPAPARHRWRLEMHNNLHPWEAVVRARTPGAAGEGRLRAVFFSFTKRVSAPESVAHAKPGPDSSKLCQQVIHYATVECRI